MKMLGLTQEENWIVTIYIVPTLKMYKKQIPQ